MSERKAESLVPVASSEAPGAAVGTRHLCLLRVLEEGSAEHVWSLPRRPDGPQHKSSTARASPAGCAGVNARNQRVD